METIYLDNAATTKIRDEVFDVMKDVLANNYGNPSSIYKVGRESKVILENAREKIAKALECATNEIYFTSSGTEADNWAIKGVYEANKDKGNHIITTKVEHHAVLHVCEYLEKNGCEVTYLDVDEFGLINIDDLKAAIRPSTILISVMFANNEIGSVMPIKEIGDIAKEHKIIFHTDAVQAVGHVPIKLDELNIDLLSMSGHKLHGPKGVGALYIKKGCKIKSILHGGAQERRRRPSTENVAGIAAMATAVELAVEEMEDVNKKLVYLRDKLIRGILETIPHCKLNGHPTKRLPNNVNIVFNFIEGESLLLKLDQQKICASSGSACTSGSLDPSHVLIASGLKHEEAHGSLRLSLSMYSTEDEIDIVIEKLKPIVEYLRNMSPLYEEFLKNNK